MVIMQLLLLLLKKRLSKLSHQRQCKTMWTAV